ncbi:MAG: glycoside hydrolase family 172 protein [Planctomycetota bacterium]
MFDGLSVDASNLHRLSAAKTRSISAENPTGERSGGGRAESGFADVASGNLGRGWKVNPATHVEPGQAVALAEIDGPGALQHLWMTCTGDTRLMVLRIYWDGQDQPSVQCPLGDFFACGWKRFAQVSSAMVCVNPGLGFNCYWVMPFRKHCRVTVENLHHERATLFYQVDYALNDVPDDAAYFHACFRRENPVGKRRVYTVLDGVEGRGHYVGTYLAWQVNNNGWWGEGEIKFYLDGDWPPDQDCAEHGGDAFPTICGTGTEDYFCGAYNFDPAMLDPDQPHAYHTYTTPYAGLPQVLRPNGVYRANTRFGLYRWHVTDPIRFQSDIKVTLQDLGWNDNDNRYRPQQSDIASVAYWYQTLPHRPLPDLPPVDELQIV